MTAPRDSELVDTTLVVLAGRVGDPVAASTLTPPPAQRVLAVDSGLHLCVALGLEVDLVIGDLDSVDADVLAAAKHDGVETEVHPRDKSHTDLALALEAAQRAGTRRIVVIGGAGGRLDQGLANLLALADPSLAQIEVDAILGGAHVHVVRETPRTLQATPGQLVSLQAIGAEARGVTTTGLRWNLQDEALTPTSTRGVSNEFVQTTATVVTRQGVLLAILPASEEHLES